MSGDYSRHTFNPRRNVAGVFMQQGRVQLDADWNELVDVLARRQQAASLDTFGPAVVPMETPDGFKITAAGGVLKIGRGRIYVDGLLAENHGKESNGWDRRLAEPIGTDSITYLEQPYLPSAPALPAGGPHLVYLDVWQRELTAIEQPDLVDQAVRVDTTTRKQTIWQVKVLPNVGAITKTTPEANIPGWPAATGPSDGRLTTLEVPVAVDPNPCATRAEGGYRGLENQLYRVEIHEGGPAGTATFKWSRDNATVATRVTSLPATNELIVESTGKDDVLGFKNGDWVEVLDDRIEFGNGLGEIRQISPIGGVDKAGRKLKLATALTTFAVMDSAAAAARNLRVRRWDSAGAIPVPTGGANATLENGIAVSFSVAATGGAFKRGDYWTFAARTADASIETLTAAPPRGTHHHYCPLALVTFPGTVEDWRAFWPPPSTAPAPADDHDGCGCSVCVTAESHAKGTGTLQAAIDKVAKTGGTVCIAAGDYRLSEPLKIAGVSIRLVGQGTESAITAPPGKPAMVIDEGTHIAVERLLVASDPRGGAQAVVVLRNCTEATISECSIHADAKAATGQAAIGLVGYAMGLRVTHNMLIAPRGIARLPDRKDPYLLTRSVAIDGNRIMCEAAGIVLDAPALHYLDTRITANLISGGGATGIVLSGATLRDSSVEISGNHLAVNGSGIVISTSSTRVVNNDISGNRAAADADGIAVEPGLSKRIDGLQIVGNRVHHLPGAAIALRAPILWAAIKRNDLTFCGGGVVMEEAGMAQHLAIDNNRIESIGVKTNEKDAAAVGVRLQKVQRVDIVGNAISQVGRSTVQGSQRVGVQTIGCASVRISGNRITAIGPAGEFVGTGAGIEVLAPFMRVDVNENVVLRSGRRGDQLGAARWQALEIGGDQPGTATVGKGRTMAASKSLVMVVGKHTSTVIENTGPGQVSVRGNQLRAELSQTAAVRISGALMCTFSENQCDNLGAANRSPVVSIERAGAVVANGNHMVGDPRIPSMTVAGTTAAIVANVGSGPLLLNGQPLPQDFLKLNVTVP